MDSIAMTKTRPASAELAMSLCSAMSPCGAMSPCSQVGAEGPRLQAPTGAAHGTGLSIAGATERVSGELGTTYAGVLPTGMAAFAGVRTTDLPVPAPRGAPV